LLLVGVTCRFICDADRYTNPRHQTVMPAEKSSKKSALPSEALGSGAKRLASIGARLHLDTGALAKKPGASQPECEALRETCDRLRQSCE
jgi:hypothetical protein